MSYTLRVSGPTELVSFENFLNTSDYFMQIMKIVLKCPSDTIDSNFIKVFFVVKQRENL